MAYTYPLRSANESMFEGATEGSIQRIGKDWGGPKTDTVHPLPPCVSAPMMHVVVRDESEDD